MAAYNRLGLENPRSETKLHPWKLLDLHRLDMDFVVVLQAAMAFLYLVCLMPRLCRSSRTDGRSNGNRANPKQAMPTLAIPQASNTKPCTPHDTSCCRINGKNVHYDSIKHICCDGTLRDRQTNGGKIYCCGKQLYNPSESLCCRGTIQSIQPNNVHPRCCGSAAYDANRLICCKRRLRSRLYVHAQCCHGHVIDAMREVCCDGNRQSSTEGKTACCGRISYNPSKDSCCSGVLNANTATNKCCGTRNYDPTQSICCSGRVYNTPGLSCCAGKTYNKTKHMCCGGSLVTNVGSNIKCCCTAQARRCVTYDITSRHVCCGGRLARKVKASDACCGTDVYDVNKQMCCGNTPLTITPHSRWRCCQGNPYDNTVQICCDGKIGRRQSRRATCCGHTAYDPTLLRCVDFFYSKVSLRTGQYCGRVVYKPDRQICCRAGSGNTILAKSFGWSSRCCGRKLYNSKTQMCCGGVINGPLPDGIPQCCRTRAFNVLKRRCDRVSGHIVSRAVPRMKYCGFRMTEFDSTVRRCCGEALYGANQACCRGKVIEAPGISLGKARCCNRKPYDKSTQICCNGHLALRGRNVKCCGRSAYNSSTHACCNGRPYPEGFTCCGGLLHPTPGTRLRKGQCCGGMGYNPGTQICCRETIYHRKTNQTKCCRDRPFDASRNQITCCHTRLTVTPYRNARCCGRRAYNPVTHICCRARIHPGRNRKCCGRNSFNPRTEICCGGKHVYPIAKYGRQCCKDLAYNAGSSICRAGRVHINVKLCGRVPYTVSTQMCCAGTIRAKRRNLKCCGAVKYNVFKSICCGDKVYSMKRFVCCGGRAHDAAVYRCCGQRPMRSKIACCGGRRCNKIDWTRQMRTEICKENDNTVVFLSQYTSTGKESLHTFKVLRMLKGKLPSSRTYKVNIQSQVSASLQVGKKYLIVGRIIARTITASMVPLPWGAKLRDIIRKELKHCTGPRKGHETHMPVSVKYRSEQRQP